MNTACQFWGIVKRNKGNIFTTTELPIFVITSYRSQRRLLCFYYLALFPCLTMTPCIFLQQKCEGKAKYNYI